MFSISFVGGRPWKLYMVSYEWIISRSFKKGCLSFWRHSIHLFFMGLFVVEVALAPPKSSEETPWRFFGSSSHLGPGSMEAQRLPNFERVSITNHSQTIFPSFFDLHIPRKSKSAKHCPLVGFGILYMGSIPKTSHFSASKGQSFGPYNSMNYRVPC